MSEAKAAGQPSGKASPRSELRGCLKRKRKWPDHLRPGHLVTQAKAAKPPWGKAYPRSELRGCPPGAKTARCNQGVPKTSGSALPRGRSPEPQGPAAFEGVSNAADLLFLVWASQEPSEPCEASEPYEPYEP
eukprot:3081177-Pyramimonas_sp.AAC.1